MSYQTWAIHPQGCPTGAAYDSCVSNRGGIFSMNASSTWDSVGLYGLQIEENLEYDGNAYYGYDVVGLGGVGEGGPTLKNTTVGDLAVEDFYIGLFGLNPKPTNWSTFEDGAPSYMTQLKEQKLIPSVSFGYTAGAPYRFTGVLASLTLGGHDTSRVQPNDVQFTFAADNSRDTVVAVQSISFSDSASTNASALLPEPIFALIDSTVAELWLPIEACQKFEQAFGLVLDPTTSLYLVNSSLHNDLLTQNPNITITLGQGLTGGAIVVITLPYAAFDLTAKSPYQGLQNSTNYFPLRQAQNETQYTLGRTFMQEAYITVDYERAIFNVSQCLWQQDPARNLVAIQPASASEASNYAGNTATKSSTTKSLATATIAGIAVGSALVVLVLTAIVIWHFRRRRRQGKHGRRSNSKGDRSEGGSAGGASGAAVGAGDKGTNVFPKAELAGTEAFSDHKDRMSTPSYGSPGTGTTLSPSSGHPTYNSDGTLFTPLTPDQQPPTSGDTTLEKDSNQVHEMPGSAPELPQADSRQITEKDMMQHREREYNGVNVHVQQQRERLRRERQTVDPDEIREATAEEGGNNRFSFAQGDDERRQPAMEERQKHEPIDE